MTDASDQLRLSLPNKTVAVDPSVIARLPSMTKAIVLCSELAGLVNDKDQARAIDIDPSTWSLIRAGQRHFPHEKYLEMFDQFGNEAPLLYMLYQRGYDLNALRKRETETERELRMERERRIDAEQKLAYAESLLKR